MIYPQNFEQKIGFDQIRQLLKEKCLSTLGEERVTDMVFSDRFNEVEERLDQVTVICSVYPGHRQKDLMLIRQ